MSTHRVTMWEAGTYRCELVIEEHVESQPGKARLELSAGREVILRQTLDQASQAVVLAIKWQHEFDPDSRPRKPE